VLSVSRIDRGGSKEVNESVALLVLGGLLLGVERPKESGFEISAKGDRVTVKGEGFELHASRIRYDQNKALLICDQGLLSIMEPLHTQHTISPVALPNGRGY
jgi:hypothetical protein